MIASLLLVLVVIVYFERYKERFALRNHFYYALIAKLLGGVATLSLFLYYYGFGDLQHYYEDAGLALDLLVTHPSKALKFLISGDVGGLSLHYSNQPRALFFVRSLMPFILLTSKSIWGLTILLSTISFVVFWLVANVIRERYPVAAWAVAIAFFYVPEVLLWSSSILKETFSLTIQLLLLYFVLTGEKKSFLKVILFLLFSLLLLKLKFYVAAIYIPILVAYAMAINLKYGEHKVFIGSFVALVVLATMIHPHLNVNSFLEQLHRNMLVTQKISTTGKSFQLPFDGSLLTFIESIPFSILGYFRPFVWEASGLMLVLLSIIRIDLLIGIGLAFRWMKKWSFEASVIMTYTLLMMVLLGIASPNYGTLSRYCVTFLPFLILLVAHPVFSHFERSMEEK